MAGLSLKGLGLNVTGSVEAEKFLEAPVFRGQINVVPFNLRSLMKKLNQELPITADKTVFTNVGIETQFVRSDSLLDVREMTMVLDQTEIKGDFSIAGLDKSVIKFDIVIDKINADHYLSPVEDELEPLTPETAAGAAAQLPAETLQALNIDGSLLIGELTLSKATMNNVNLRVKGLDGKIELNPVTAELYKGRYSGKITLDANGKLPKLAVNSALNGVQIDKLLKATTGKADMVGKSDISLFAIAHGANTNTLKQTLSGEAKLLVVDGIVRGVDIPSTLAQVERMINTLQFGKPNTDGETHFDTLKATLPIQAGVVSNQNLKLSGSGFEVEGKGIIANLADMTWRYDLRVTADKRTTAPGEKTYDIGGQPILIKCRGEIAPDNCEADKFRFAGSAAKKLFLDQLNKPADDASTETDATDGNTDPGKALFDSLLKGISK
jgi:AsmA protein